VKVGCISNLAIEKLHKEIWNFGQISSPSFHYYSFQIQKDTLSNLKSMG
jgi:hypothetical protein